MILLEKSEMKKRFKMYKAGKAWVVAPLVFFGLAVGVSTNIKQVAADTVSQAQTTTVTADASSHSLTRQPSTASSEATDSSQAESTTSAAASTVATTATSEASVSVSSTSAASTSSQVASSEAQTSQASTTVTSQASASVATTSVEAKVAPATSEAAKTSEAKEDYPTPAAYVEKNEGGHWYLYVGKQKQTGFQKLKDGRVVYYNNAGQMQYGQQNIQSYWYLFDRVNGAMKYGFQRIADQNKTVYYDKQGRMQYGHQTINNANYYFDKGTGAMQTGLVVDNGARYYYAANGKQAYGQQNVGGHWYLFDQANNGKAKTGFTQIKDQNKTVYYNGAGQMQYGQQNIGGHWYNFDKVTGKMSTGFTYLKDQSKTVYYNAQGQMQYGWQELNKAKYYFDKWTGAMAKGLQTIANAKYLFDNDGKMQTGQRNLGGYWYNFDQVTGKMSTGLTYLPNQNKKVYYNAQGQMQYGFQKLNGATYYFDPALGTQAVGQKHIKGHWYYFDAKKGMATGLTYLPDQKKVVYYNNQGQMQYGQQVLNGVTYYVDLVTGEQLKDNVAYNRKTGQINYYGKDGKQAHGMINLAGKTYDFTKDYLQGQGLVTVKGQTFLLNGNKVVTGQQRLNNHWYYFSPTSGKMATGLTYLPDQKKTVYYNDQGQMLYGQQNVGGHWYLFDRVTGAMKTGLQWIASQNKTVYYAANGQMQYGWQNVNGHRYFFNFGTGAQASAEIVNINGHFYAFDSRGNGHDFNELNALVNRLGTNIAVVIQSQKSGQIYAYSNSGNMRFQMASTVKVGVLAELLHNKGGNLTATERRLAERMIRNSDNAATTNLINYHLWEGGNPVGRLYRDLQMWSTTPRPAWGTTLTTPTDQLKLLYQIYLTNNSSYLNRASQDYLKGLMHTVNSSQRWGISAGSGDYYLKNGWMPAGWSDNGPWVVNSIGFIPNNGHGYTIAIYSVNNPLYTGINKVEQVARKVSQMLK